LHPRKGKEKGKKRKKRNRSRSRRKGKIGQAIKRKKEKEEKEKEEKEEEEEEEEVLDNRPKNPTAMKRKNFHMFPQFTSIPRGKKKQLKRIRTHVKKEA